MPLGIKNETKKYNSLNSWWSKEFLFVFQDLDEDIVRKARELSSSAKFNDISISSGSVLARVSDENNANIRVEFALEPLSELDLSHCKEFLASSSLVLTEIALGKLPSILNEELLNLNIELIPPDINSYKSRSSHSSNSSFPKAGEFCEYSLALIYKFAAEIDKDANLWLNFRGLEDLISELSFTDKETNLRSFEDIMACLISPQPDLEDLSEAKDYNQDLSGLNFDYNSALSLLEDKPSFDEDLDFKQFLLEIYNLAATKADSLYEKWLDKSRNRKAETDLELSLNPEAISYSELFQFSIPIKKLLRYSLNQDLNSVYSNKLSFTLLMLQTAVLICKNGTYFPEIVNDDTGAIFIRYKPIFNNDELSLRLSELYKLCPEDFFIRSKVALNELLSYIVNFLVKDLVKNLKGFPKSNFRKAFLIDEKYKAETLSEENNINASALWLGKLELQNFDLRPLLSLEEEAKNSFRLSLNLLDLLSEARERLHLDLSKENLESNFSPERIEGLYKQLYLLQDYVPALKQIVSTEAKAKPNLSLNALADLLIKADHILPVLGLDLALPESLKDLIKPSLCLKLNVGNDSNYRFEYQVLMGDKFISLNTFQNLLKENPSELFFYDAKYTLLASKDKEQLLKRSSLEIPKLSNFWDALYHYRTGNSEGLSLVRNKKLDSYFEDFFASKNLQNEEVIPKTLDAKLKVHQIEGFNWLYENYKKGFGSCLADDMGLGKTLQVISLLTKIYLDNDSSLKNISLVLCPSSLTKNWINECVKFAPRLKVKAIQDIKSKDDLEEVQVLVSSYTSFRHKLKILGDYNWETLIVDEAHNIRNPSSKQSQLVRSLQAKYRIALTATPVEKKLSDLWTIFDFINPNYLRSLKEFTYEFAIPVEKYREKSKMKNLEHVIAPFMLRREKSSAALAEDFVKKNVETHILSLKPEQKEVYQNRYKEFLVNLKSASPVEKVRLVQQCLRDLTLLLNSPENSAKADKLSNILKPILSAGEKVVIFTQFKETAEDLKMFIDKALEHETLLYHGGLSAKKRADSLSEFAESPEKQILIITIKAGGTGLNLVQANHLVHYDFTWNKAQENQASDRIYRIGQTKDVFIHRLISRGTFEQKFDQILDAKSETDIQTVDLVSEFARLSN